MAVGQMSSIEPLHPFEGRNVPWLLKTRADQLGDKAFLVFEPFGRPPVSISYADFERRVQSYAAGLAAKGVNKGDAVIIHMGNCPEFLISWFACSVVGAIAVTTNIHSAEGELKYFAEHSGAAYAITQPELYGALARGAQELKWIACLNHNCGAPAETPQDDRFIAFETLAGDPIDAPCLNADPMAPNSIMYTSGTTSRPKAVVYTHANVLWGAQRNAAHCELTQDDVAYTFLPLFHANALSYSMLATLWSGGALVFHPKFTASRFWETTTRNKCTWASIGPFVTKALEELPRPDKHYFRFWGNIIGHDPDVMALCGIPTLGWWGMTETISHPIYSDMRFPSQHRVMGRPAPEYGVAIIDDNNKPTAPGGVGRLLIKGEPGVSMFLEYLNDDDATQKSYNAEGWFDTGDMVTLHADGGISFADRDKDMLKVGGENVAASEVEEIIMNVPGVVEAAIVGAPHDFLHETPYAFVVASAPESQVEADIHTICEKNLATFKRPRTIEFIDALPRTPIGKMDKKELRERVQKTPSKSASE